MFHSARIKLTIWYAMIIMLVSLAFSAVIYRVLSAEVTRFARVQRYRFERNIVGPGFRIAVPLPPVSDPYLIAELQHRLVLILLGVNGFILVTSTGLAYFMAGKTLMPIKLMVDEQERFIGDASHELRTPLTSLKSAFEVFLREKKPTLKEARQLASESIEEVNRLQALSDSLLQLAKYQKPNGQIKYETVSIRQTIEEAVKKTKPMAEIKNININPLQKDYDIYANKYALTDLWVILLDNAIKYGREGEEVEISISKTDGWIVVKVVDRGIGIAKEDLAHVWERFYRADKVRNKGGYGLGLSIAKQIVEKHQGTIWVESKLGEGTTFAVRLPHKGKR